MAEQRVDLLISQKPQGNTKTKVDWFLWNRKEITMKIEKNIFNVNISIQMPLFITEDKKKKIFFETHFILLVDFWVHI